MHKKKIETQINSMYFPPRNIHAHTLLTSFKGFTDLPWGTSHPMLGGSSQHAEALRDPLGSFQNQYCMEHFFLNCL
jgi:hypothetical protein